MKTLHSTALSHCFQQRCHLLNPTGFSKVYFIWFSSSPGGQPLPKSISVFNRSFSLTNHRHSLFWWGSELLSSPEWSMYCYLRFTALSAASAAAEAKQIHHGMAWLILLIYHLLWKLNPGTCPTNISIRYNNDPISFFFFLLLEKVSLTTTFQYFWVSRVFFFSFLLKFVKHDVQCLIRHDIIGDLGVETSLVILEAAVCGTVEMYSITLKGVPDIVATGQNIGTSTEHNTTAERNQHCRRHSIS